MAASGILIFLILQWTYDDVAELERWRQQWKWGRDRRVFHLVWEGSDRRAQRAFARARKRLDEWMVRLGLVEGSSRWTLSRIGDVNGNGVEDDLNQKSQALNTEIGVVRR